MKQLDQFSRAGLAAMCIWAMSVAASAEDAPIAGLEPSMRPAGAPVITTYPKDAAWYRHALTGVVPPYPTGLHFLENQGAWHSPFVRPGMTGPYDIRNWHGSTRGAVQGGTGQAAAKR